LIARIATATCRWGNEQSWEEALLDLRIEKIVSLRALSMKAVVRSEAAFKLREAVTSLRDARVIVLDLSEMRGHRKRRSRHAAVSATMGLTFRENDGAHARCGQPTLPSA